MFFAFNGTAANSLALSSLCQSYHSVICSETAHVETDAIAHADVARDGGAVMGYPRRSAWDRITR